VRFSCDAIRSGSVKKSAQPRKVAAVASSAPRMMFLIPASPSNEHGDWRIGRVAANRCAAMSQKEGGLQACTAPHAGSTLLLHSPFCATASKGGRACQPAAPAAAGQAACARRTLPLLVPRAVRAAAGGREDPELLQDVGARADAGGRDDRLRAGGDAQQHRPRAEQRLRHAAPEHDVAVGLVQPAPHAHEAHVDAQLRPSCKKLQLSAEAPAQAATLAGPQAQAALWSYHRLSQCQ